MPKVSKKKLKTNQTYLILVIGLILAGAGYFGYRSMLTSPDVNQINWGEGGGANVRQKPTNKIQKPKLTAPKIYNGTNNK